MQPSFAFSCMLCGSSDYIIRIGHARDNATLVPLECTSCGLVSLSSHEHINDNYYEQSHMHDFVSCDPALLMQQDAENTERRYLQWKNIFVGKHILDIGCGAGGFLLKMREIAASVSGIEPELRLQKHFIQNTLDVYPTFSALPQNKHFDIVTMFCVLEHIKTPLEMLREIYNKGGKTFIVEVPNANDALLSLYENESYSQFVYWSCHLYLFTSRSLKTLIEKAGFKTKEVFQCQRYSLANHLYWLSKGRPGGQNVLGALFSEKTYKHYANDLAKQEKCDTIIGVFEW